MSYAFIFSSKEPDEDFSDSSGLDHIPDRLLLFHNFRGLKVVP